MATFTLYTFFVAPLTLGFAVLILFNMRQRIEIERLLANAKQDARYLAAYHQWCTMNGCAPSSSDLIAARAALGEDKPFEDRWDNA